MDREKDIVYSESVKAGKRIYYLDVKRNRRGELYLCITESKKITQGEDPEAPFTFEKHKIFLYEEDFGKFIDALSKAVGYIHREQPEGLRHAPATETGEAVTAEPLPDEELPLPDDLKIDIDFE